MRGVLQDPAAIQNAHNSLYVSRARHVASAPSVCKTPLSLRARSSRSLRVLAQKPERSGRAIALVRPGESLYYESFLRSLILGVSAGAAFEGLHVGIKFFSLWYEVGYTELVTALPRFLDRFSPLVVNDHIIAAGCWLLFYVIEAVAIVRVLEQHKQNPDAAAQALKSLTTLPKLMLPRLGPFRTTLDALGNGVAAPFQPALSSGPEETEDRPEELATMKSSVLAPPKPEVIQSEGKNNGKLSDSSSAPQERIGSGGGRKVPGILEPGKGTPPILDPRQEPEGQPTEDVQASPPDAPLDDLSATTLQKKRASLGLRPGQLDLSTAEVFNREKELAERKMVLADCWYAAELSKNVQQKPVEVEMLGEKLVLIRDSKGVVQCLQDVCPHRGAPLHLGWRHEVKGHDCIVCPYHGWAFDMGGHLRDVPASESSKDWPSKPLIDTYHVQEKGGFVWLFYGSKQMPMDERPPIPYVPELDDASWKPVYNDIKFECNHWSVFENAIDMAHIHYLHNDSFGNQDKPEIRDMTCRTEAFHVTGDFVLHNKPVNAFWALFKVPEVRVHAKAFLPSTSVIQFTLGRGLSFITFVSTVPISANRSINRFALVRRLNTGGAPAWLFNLKIWDWFAEQAMLRILEQDKDMVEKLVPEMLGREISVKPDLVQIAFRKLRKSFIQMGYGVSPQSKSQKDM